MHLRFLTGLALLAVSVSAYDVGGPHGDHEVIVKRDTLQAVAVHRRHHIKRASAAKCRAKGTTKKTSSSSSSRKKPASTSSDSTAETGTSSNTRGSSSSGNSTRSDTSSSSTGLLSGITEFLGTNSGIGSWFRTSNPQDDTNGRSWCQLNYQDDWLGFAPDVSKMLGNFGNQLATAGEHYCGLEAKATNPQNGNTALIYIVDGFATQWVRTPGSIDLTLAAFKALYGSETSDKNVVIQDLQWEFTGQRKEEYTFNSCCK